MSKQKTLKGSFALSGKGLHTGLNLTVIFNPAPENHGYKIQRIDLEGQPVIDAVAEKVIDTQRGTVLGNGDMRISTIEHGMSALYALGIDNCLIQVNGPEFPILDGSALMYVEKIKEVGVQEQNAEKDYYIIKHKLEVKDEESGAVITILPDDEFSITTMCSFESKFINSQFATIDNLDNYATEIAPARTFVFVRDIMPLLQANLIKGGDMDNAIVIYERQVDQEKLDQLADLLHVPHMDASKLGYIQHKPLMWENECTRHKLLDIIGDMALIGKPIKGRIVATSWPHHQQQVRPHDAQGNTQTRDTGSRIQSQRGAYHGQHPHPPVVTPSLSHAAHRQSHLHGSHQHRGRKERHGQRAFLPGALPRRACNARRVAGRGHGTMWRPISAQPTRRA